MTEADEYLVDGILTALALGALSIPCYAFYKTWQAGKLADVVVEAAVGIGSVVALVAAAAAVVAVLYALGWLVNELPGRIRGWFDG